MTLNNYYRHFRETLQSIYNLNESSKITEMIFEYFIHVTKSDVIKFPDKIISIDEEYKLNNVLQRLCAHHPVQYVIGEAWFCDLKFKVNESVLIPRPETEELVALIVNYVRLNKNTKDILDIGTGSGCIPISLKKTCRQINITSIDVSADALELAKLNAIKNDTNIIFQQIDFLDKESWGKLGTYDIIVSNPPYIPFSEKSKMDKNVIQYEPEMALFVPDQNPLIFYDAILQFAKNHLNPDGTIFLEIYENFGEAMIQLCNNNDYKATLEKDVYDKERMIIASPSR